MSPPRSREPLVLLLLALGVLVWSGIAPKDRFTWLLEVLPVLVGVPILVATHRRFPLTPLLYRLLFGHAVILMAGGHWTYAEVPFGFWMKETFHFARNHYDRIGHLAQGFVPAMVAREVLLRGRYVRTRAMLAFLVLCVVLAISASYELVEWLAAVVLGQGADEFLGTQGDPWDTQSDMLMALIGAGSALLLLSGLQDRQIAALRH